MASEAFGSTEVAMSRNGTCPVCPSLKRMKTRDRGTENEKTTVEICRHFSPPNVRFGLKGSTKHAWGDGTACISKRQYLEIVIANDWCRVNNTKTPQTRVFYVFYGNSSSTRPIKNGRYKSRRKFNERFQNNFLFSTRTVSTLKWKTPVRLKRERIKRKLQSFVRMYVFENKIQRHK